MQTIKNSILFKQTKINRFKHKQNQQIPIDFEYKYENKQIHDINTTIQSNPINFHHS